MDPGTPATADDGGSAAGRGSTGRAGTRPAWYLAAEYGLVFFGLVTVYAVLARGTSPIPVLLVLGAAVLAHLLRSPTFDRSELRRPHALAGQLRSIAGLWLVTAAVAVAAVALITPERLFELPRREPLLWALVMVLYPLFSVYPQELVFRTFLFHRYRPVFGDGQAMVAASAAAFGYAHIAFGNWVAVVLSLAAGWVFAGRYRRTRSLITVSVEHALYGVLVFTVGLGEYFFHGSVS